MIDPKVNALADFIALSAKATVDSLEPSLRYVQSLPENSEVPGELVMEIEHARGRMEALKEIALKFKDLWGTASQNMDELIKQN